MDATRTIMLDHTLKGEDLELVLLHEMAHIGSAAAAHGPQFKQEVRRLLRRLNVTEGDTHLLMGAVRKLLWRLRSGADEAGGDSG